jgi:rRNA maturation endonuclease Nob1
VKTKIICSCGEVLDWQSDFCPNCGKNIKRAFDRHRTIKNIRDILR